VVDLYAETFASAKAIACSSGAPLKPLCRAVCQARSFDCVRLTVRICPSDASWRLLTGHWELV